MLSYNDLLTACEQQEKEVENMKKELEKKDNEITAIKTLLEKATEKITKLGIQITQQAGIIARLEKQKKNDRIIKWEEIK
jgi:archaellum component FlaC